jgi:tetratricopeptide (TPR) repeat protein
MFDGLLGFFQNSWRQFLELKSIEQLSVVATIGAAIAPPMYGYWRFVTRRLRLKGEELHRLQGLSENRFQQIKKLQQELKERDDAIGRLESQLPDHWLQQAAEEREEGNEKRAISRLRTGFESIREALSTCCLDLASHHFSLVPDYDERHFGEAERLARIAMLLRPSDKDTRLFLAQILAVEAEGKYASGNYQAYEALWEEAEDFLEIGNDSENIGIIGNYARQYYEHGHYRLAECVFRRVSQMCKRHFGQDSPITLTMRSLHASSLGEAGHYREALSLSQALLPDLERVLGQDHPDTLTARNNIAAWTGQAGDAAGALALSQALLPDRERVLGQDGSVAKSGGLKGLGVSG